MLVAYEIQGPDKLVVNVLVSSETLVGGESSAGTCLSTSIPPWAHKTTNEVVT